MMGLKFNDVHSDTFGLVMKTVQRSAGASLRQKEVVIPGRDGTFVFPYKKRNTKTHIARFTYTATNMTDIRQKERQIGAWLSAQEAYLIFDDEPDVAYLATAYSEITPTEDYLTREIEIEFVCQPFGIAIEETEISETVTGSCQKVIQYEGTHKIGFGGQMGAYFNVEINGSFTSLNIKLNDTTISFETPSASGVITIDNVNGKITKDDTNYIDRATFSDFLTLYANTNLLEISGESINCIIKVKYNALYI